MGHILASGTIQQIFDPVTTLILCAANVAVQPSTVVGDMLGSAFNGMLAMGGTSPGSATTFSDALAVIFPAVSSDCTET